MTRKALVFIDEWNITSAARSLGKAMDWAQLIGHVERLLDDDGFTVVDRYIYVAMPPKTPERIDDYLRKQGFTRWLGHAGFVVTEREGCMTADGPKSNVDVMIAADVMRLALMAKPDAIVLCSRDGDFGYLVHELRRMGITTYVAGAAPAFSAELRASANTVLDLGSFIESMFENLPEQQVLAV